MQILTPADHTHILPPLSCKSLLSIGTFSDNGYITIFHDSNKGAMMNDCNNITITNTQPTMLQGWHNDKGLWCIPLTTTNRILHNPASHCINNVYNLPSTAHKVCYLHTALGFPTKTTLLAAIRNDNLTTFPSLTVANMSWHFPKSNETLKGHMKQIQQGLQSTKPTLIIPPFSPTPGIKYHNVYLRVFDAIKKSMYTDLTSCFPITSHHSHKYVMVAVELDGNYIDAKCMKPCKTNDLIKAYQTIHQHWKDSQVISVNWHFLDNEALRELKAAIHSNGCTVKLTPPNIH
ncbi:hypothetical protein ACHAW6_013036 [Cyclotella cf. meneghiniana]